MYKIIQNILEMKGKASGTKLGGLGLIIEMGIYTKLFHIGTRIQQNEYVK